MMARFLLDTNAISECVKPVPHHGFLRKFQHHEQETAISATTWHELLFGANRLPKGKRKDALDLYYTQLATTTPIIAYDDDAAELHARERARLEALGRTTSLLDGQIAAVAVLYGLTLVTRNTSDFLYFQDLTVVNWMDP
jgi:tRNA(fMet)-specific endonuclease VapC